MSLNFPYWRSLKTRITLFTLAIFVIGIWLLALYAGRMLHQDMQHQLGEQQFSTVSILADHVNEHLTERLNALEMVAGSISPAILNDTASLQKLLEERPLLQNLFNAGVTVINTDGTAIADVPSIGRIGINYMGFDVVDRVLKDGRATISQPVMGPVLRAPVFAMAVPIRGSQGNVIGALGGVINLGIPNFLDEIAGRQYGKTGSYTLVVKQHRLIVTATNKSRILEALPASGLSPIIDRFIQGYEGFTVSIDSHGTEALQSVKGVPVASWYVEARLPTEEAFAPVRTTLRHLLLATIIFTLLTGSLIWWMLRRQFSPMLIAVKALASQSDTNQSPQLLPITSHDEIGELIDSFNHLLEALAQREAALQESEFHWKFAIEGSGDGVWDWNLQTDEAKYSRRWKEMLGYFDDDILPKHDEWVSRIHPDDRLYVAETMQAYLEWKTQIYVVEYRLRCKDGSYKWILGRGMIVNRDDEGKPLRMIGTHTDITKRKQAEIELRVAATAFESQQGLLITDTNNVILKVNRAFTNITGYTAEEAIGNTPHLLNSGRQDKDFYAAMWDSVNNKGVWEGEIWNRRKSGEIYPEYLTITAVKDMSGAIVNYVASLTDITERMQAANEIQQLAFYDGLTGLPNRRLLLDRLKHALATSTRSGRDGALLFLDLDHFKTLNDTLGHDIGDLLLQQVAVRLTACVREGDSVARLGGDEFVVLLEDLSEQNFEAAAQAEIIANKILHSLNQSYQLAKHEYHCTPSIGVTLFNNHQSALEDLLKQADIAMYQAKKAGRNTMRFFDPEMQASITVRAALERELRKALAQQQFQLYYQIQVDHLSHPLGAEALIRWLHPERGLVSPFDFIPLAEETGLILPIGQWVLNTACSQLKAWQEDALTRELTLSINVSARQFRQATFVEQVQTAVQLHAINPLLLKLELTESLLLDNIEDSIATMSSLNAIGVKFSLDDFGTGYSSLQYLKQLPLTQLKIDRSFIQDIVIDSSDKAIVRTIITMAQGLNLEIIAEGVETNSQLACLRKYGCNHFQGHLFGKAMPIVQFEELLKHGLLEQA